MLLRFFLLSWDTVIVCRTPKLGIGAESRQLSFVQSYLIRDEKNARFYGNLDIKTLGGAGFASQRTVSEDKNWDLSEYAGIQLDIAKGDSESTFGERT